jgi:hypothetical protein
MSESEREYIDTDIQECSEEEVEDRPRKRRDTLHNITSRVADDGFTPITADLPIFFLILSENVEIKENIQPALLIDFDGREDPQSIFFRFLPGPVWEKLLVYFPLILLQLSQIGISENLRLKRNCSNSRSHRSSHKEVTFQELIQFYGILMVMEDTYGNSTKDIREHFQEIKSKLQVLPFGVNRFLAIFQALDPSIEVLKEICSILEDANYRYFCTLSL